MASLLLCFAIAATLQAPTLDQQRRTLEDSLRHHPDDVNVLIALGDVYRQWPVVGRYKAWRLYGDAAERDPDNPAPRYGQLQVGLHLRGDDGERMMRDAVFAMLALTPDYRDIWDIWDTMYHGDGHRERAVRLLARWHTPLALRRRAMLLIELQRYTDAATALDSALAGAPQDPALLALRAEAAFAIGDTVLGIRRYWEAAAQAAHDTAGVLWRQIRSIATPDEQAAWITDGPFERSRFLTAFWARREPDLTTAVNERLPEHFQRLQYVRDHYRILHPFSSFHSSARWRALQAGHAGDVAASLRDAPDAVRQDGSPLGISTLPGRSALEEDLQDAGVYVDFRDLPEPDSLTRYAMRGFDGRGLLWMRYGRPVDMSIAESGDAEAWIYVIDGRAVRIPLGRTNGTAGDIIVYPLSPRDLRNAELALERDQSALRATREMRGWVAWFRSDADGWQDVLVAATADTAAAAAWDERTGQPMDRVAGATPLTLRLPAGEFTLGLDGRTDAGLARLRTSLTVPRLGGWLSLSSILVAVGIDTIGGRADFAAAMPATLVLRRGGQPITIYAEVYDLPPRGDAVSYRVTYTFEPAGRGDPIEFAFDRLRPAQSTLVEQLTLQPADVPPGTYRITIRIEDRVLGLRSSTTRVELQLR